MTANRSAREEVASMSISVTDSNMDSDINVQRRPVETAVTNIQYPCLVLSGAGKVRLVIVGYKWSTIPILIGIMNSHMVMSSTVSNRGSYVWKPTYDGLLNE